MALLEVPYEKPPYDQVIIPFEYASLIDNPTYAGYELDEFEFKLFDLDGNDLSSTMIEGTPSDDGTYFYVTIKGGTDGDDYYLRGRAIFTKTDCDDFKKEWEMLIQVRQKGV